MIGLPFSQLAALPAASAASPANSSTASEPAMPAPAPTETVAPAPTPSASAAATPAPTAAPLPSATPAPEATQQAAPQLLAAPSIGTMAVNAPEPTVAAPYLHWRLSPAQAGATFEIEYRARTGTQLLWFISWGSWSAWGNRATVADCTITACAAPGDLDPDRGEFQITHVGAHRIASNSTTAEYEYRVRPASAPAGYSWTATEWRTSTQADRTNGVDDLGGFELGSNPPALCVSGTFYSLATNGVVSQVVRTGTTSSISQFGRFTGVASTAQMNAFGIGLGGTVMFAAERASGTATGLAAVHRYSVAGGWQRTAVTNVATDTSVVLGAVSLSDGRYYFGGYRAVGGVTTFQLFVYNPANAAVTAVGSFATSMTGTSNGDMAFDALGNLYVVQSATDGDTRIYTVTAAAIAAGGTMPVSSTPPFVGLSGTNGAAFEGDGTVYLGTGTTVRIYDPSTGALRAGSVTTSLSASGDLASCLSPATLTIRKDVVGRVASADQFTLSALRGTTTLGTATTTGAASGIQPVQLGPLAALAGQTYTIQETISANGSSYTSSYTCVDEDGATIASGSARSGSVTIPNRAGASVVCTFRNAPLVTSVIVRKVVEDTAGANPTPGVGWRVTAAAQATTGTVTSTPSASTQTTDAQGEARWNLQYGSASARASIAVSEAQQRGFAFVAGECHVTTVEGATSTVALPNAQGATLTGITPGSSVECTIVNRALPTTLTLVKTVPFGTAAATSWQLRATGPQGARTGPSGTTGSTQATGEITPGVAYRLTESGGPATYVQTGAWRCVDELGATVAVSAAGDVTVARSGASVTCTVTNQTARLTLLKVVVNDNGGTIGPEVFALRATPATLAGLSATTVTGTSAVTAANTLEVRPGHAYALSEDMGSYAYLGQALQRYTGPVSATPAQLSEAANWQTLTDTQAASVTVTAGQHAIYRFVNDDAPALTLPLTGGIGADTYLFGGAGVLLLGLLVAAALLVRTRIRSSRSARP
ncbi:hypothetical protein [Agrococcus sp. ARC_14]|uniref:prealbumin-like fold domain-containing protein n=1 Tax=Agrococcus sp. ARC_14 TaxID=2919927 RepID=UPI001F0661AA|nr:hypothetical protein [Agrococcus sp. ARC_14]